MPFETIPGIIGKVYIPEKETDIKKHPCKDCFSCQMCSDDRCRLCRGESFSEAEQAFLPVHDKGQTEMSDPPKLINHNGRSLSCVCVPETGKSP